MQRRPNANEFLIRDTSQRWWRASWLLSQRTLRTRGDMGPRQWGRLPGRSIALDTAAESAARRRRGWVKSVPLDGRSCSATIGLPSMSERILSRRRLIHAMVLLATPIVILITSSSSSTEAQTERGEWPQWGGPMRNFHAESARIARAWPEGGPRQRWRRPLGEGYSSILVDGGTLVTMYRRGDSEVIVALDAATGRTRWEHAYDAPLTRDGYFDVWLNSAGPGPYSTPLIADGIVFAVGVTGQVSCDRPEDGSACAGRTISSRSSS